MAIATQKQVIKNGYSKRDYFKNQSFLDLGAIEDFLNIIFVSCGKLSQNCG
ncbi:MAG: hypothetical protein HC799_19885 [Limnothrix sp. RL_2_0]|nr:hypothetical protein [Limnothrix sp. RL_2_0]